MVQVVTFKVEKREKAGKGAARAVRRLGLVPGVIYGDKQEAVLVQMDPRQLIAALHKPGFYSHQYDLVVEGGETHRVMAQDVQFHVVTDAPLHVDFLRVNKDHAVHAEVQVEFINQNECPGLKKGGTLNVVRHSVEVIARPDDLPEQIVVDLAGLEINASVHISNVKLPEGVRPAIADRDFTIATISAPAGGKTE
ncbi:50S ribosomal protein L25/general stress protein Ctc [Novispirillum itersonii]|uniref:Large ribosomal subunit protein bL25 n=1 Tax=Novispirillum itersonii TaxID=189 RepID=A0A7W9ZCY9_NOVIT|nr:50S ribosomal protein L25/general stress protein Ctc [Novispirillum itersonii]MBB6209136.1 large subunit ribosomal protein L25 [Novispirillum itersonii]